MVAEPLTNLMRVQTVAKFVAVRYLLGWTIIFAAWRAYTSYHDMSLNEMQPPDYAKVALLAYIPLYLYYRRSG